MAQIRSQLVRGHLHKINLAYKSMAHIWSEVYPSLQMKTREQKITIWNRGDEFRDEAALRAPGTVTPWSRYDTDTVDLTALNYARKHGLTKEEIEEDGETVDNPSLALQQAVMNKNARAMSLKIERLVAANVTAATWADGNSGGEDAAGGWSASSNNTFIADIFNGVNTMRQQGVDPTEQRLLMDYQTFQGVMQYSGIIDITKYGSPTYSYPDAQAIARFFNIDRCVIAGAIYSTGEKKADVTDFTTADIWGGSNNKGFGMLYKYPKVMGREIMTAGVVGFKPHKDSNKILPGMPQPQATYKWYDDDSRQWFFEQEAQFGIVQTAAKAAYAWKDTHTT